MTVKELINMEEPLEPETLKMLYPEMSTLEREQILVCRIIKNTRMVEEDMDIFENAVHVLNGMSPNVERMESCLPEHIWYALEKMKRIKKIRLSNEVKTYIKYIFKTNGCTFVPEGYGLGEDGTLDNIKRIASEGPFPLSETSEHIQVFRYMAIQQYIKIKEGKK